MVDKGSQDWCLRFGSSHAPVFRGAVELSFASVAGVYYQIEFSTVLVGWDREGYSVKGTSELQGLISNRIAFAPSTELTPATP